MSLRHHFPHARVGSRERRGATTDDLTGIMKLNTEVCQWKAGKDLPRWATDFHVVELNARAPGSLRSSTSVSRKISPASRSSGFCQSRAAGSPHRCTECEHVPTSTSPITRQSRVMLDVLRDAA